MFFSSISLLKSIEYPSANEDSSKTFFDQNQPIKTEENQIKHSPHDSESKSLGFSLSYPSSDLTHIHTSLD